MIEINLLPGSSKKASRRGPPRAGGAFSKVKMPAVDRTAGLIALAWIVGLGTIAFLHLGMGSRTADLEVRLEAAVRDSARFATLRAQGDSLTAQEGVIAQKLEVIQQIDAGRYVWPHILDEVSRAVPQYVWLEAVRDATGDASGLPLIHIDGFAGTPFALTRFMEQLEASPFLGATRLLSTAQTQAENRTVHAFALMVQYREPPPDALETVPLIGSAAQEN
jgi:type IV pilus assembly protein PilN